MRVVSSPPSRDSSCLAKIAKLLARSDAPSAAAGLATYQVDVWQVKVTWDPPDALSVERFTPSSSWRSQYTTPKDVRAADAATRAAAAVAADGGGPE